MTYEITGPPELLARMEARRPLLERLARQAEFVCSFGPTRPPEVRPSAILFENLGPHEFLFFGRSQPVETKLVTSVCAECKREFTDTEPWPPGALCLDCELTSGPPTHNRSRRST